MPHVEPKCPACDGTGLVKDPDVNAHWKCDKCGGTGGWPRPPLPRPEFPPGRAVGWSQEITGKPWPGMSDAGDAAAYAFAQTRTAKEIAALKEAVETILPSHPAYLKMKHQRNCCFWLAVAMSAWAFFSLWLIGKALERVL